MRTVRLGYRNVQKRIMTCWRSTSPFFLYKTPIGWPIIHQIYLTVKQIRVIFTKFERNAAFEYIVYVCIRIENIFLCNQEYSKFDTEEKIHLSFQYKKSHHCIQMPVEPPPREVLTRSIENQKCLDEKRPNYPR